MSSASGLSSSGTTTTRDQQFALSTGTRPYRSHKIRACDLCRKRKSRCTVDLPGQSCLLCRVQGADCHYGEEKSASMEPLGRPISNDIKSWSASPNPGQKRKRDELVSETPVSSSMAGLPASTTSKEFPSSSRPKTSQDEYQSHHGPDESMHIVGPVAAADAQVIERFLPLETSKKSPDRKTPYNVYSNDPRKPILYTKVSRRRQGLKTTGIPGETQKEIIEQILGPFRHDLVQMYVPWVPIRNPESFPSL